MKKQMLPEVLPAPIAPSTASPRERARTHLAQLRRGAALMVSAAVAPAAACADYAPAPPPIAQCAPADDVNTWISATALDGTPFTVVINLARIRGVELADAFTAEGATVDNAVFDTNNLATSTQVTVSLLPDDGATTVVLHAGLTCGDDARAIALSIDLATLRGAQQVALTVDDVTP